MAGGMMRKAWRVIPGLLVAGVLAAWWSGAAAADTLPGCASGAAPGRVVFTVSVSASGTPFVSSYAASPPAAGGNVGCAAPSAGTPTISVTGPGIAPYPQIPVPLIPSTSTVPVVPTPVNVVQAGPYLMLVPTVPGVQLYQIAPGYYMVRSTDPTQNPIVILSPLPGVPQAPNTGPIPSLIH